MGNTSDLNDVQKVELEMLVEVDRLCRQNDLKYYLAYGTALGAVRHKGFIPWDSDIDIVVDIDNYKRFCEVMENRLVDKYCIYSYETDPKYEELFARIALKYERHHKIHIDVFPMVGAPVTRSGRKLFSVIAYLIYRCYFVKKVDVNINYKNRPRKRKLALILKKLLFPLPSEFFIWLYEKLSKTFPFSKSDYIINFCGSYRYKEIIPKSYLGEPVYMEFEGHKLPVPQEWDKYLTQLYGNYLVPRR